MTILTVVQGSCGVEYRLALTDAGYEKYGGSFSTFRKVARADSILTASQ